MLKKKCFINEIFKINLKKKRYVKGKCRALQKSWRSRLYNSCYCLAIYFLVVVRHYCIERIFLYAFKSSTICHFRIIVSYPQNENNNALRCCKPITAFLYSFENITQNSIRFWNGELQMSAYVTTLFSYCFLLYWYNIFICYESAVMDLEICKESWDSFKLFCYYYYLFFYKYVVF